MELLFLFCLTLILLTSLSVTSMMKDFFQDLDSLTSLPKPGCFQSPSVQTNFLLKQVFAHCLEGISDKNLPFMGIVSHF